MMGYLLTKASGMSSCSRCSFSQIPDIRVDPAKSFERVPSIGKCEHPSRFYIGFGLWEVLGITVTEAPLIDLKNIKHTHLTLVKKLTTVLKDTFSNRHYGAVHKVLFLVDKGFFD